MSEIKIKLNVVFYLSLNMNYTLFYEYLPQKYELYCRINCLINSYQSVEKKEDKNNHEGISTCFFSYSKMY